MLLSAGRDLSAEVDRREPCSLGAGAAKRYQKAGSPSGCDASKVVNALSVLWSSFQLDFSFYLIMSMEEEASFGASCC